MWASVNFYALLSVLFKLLSCFRAIFSAFYFGFALGNGFDQCRQE